LSRWLLSAASRFEELAVRDGADCSGVVSYELLGPPAGSPPSAPLEARDVSEVERLNGVAASLWAWQRR
jgi:hypothetical protein